MFINEYSRGGGIVSEWQLLGGLALVFFVKYKKLDWCFFSAVDIRMWLSVRSDYYGDQALIYPSH
jgi:hypothetical protein